MTRVTNFLLCLLISVLLTDTGVNATPYEDSISEATVIKTLNQYGTALNALVEYALPASCNPTQVDQADLGVAAAAIIQQFFSQNIQSYVVINQTAATNGFSVVSNLTVGGGTYNTTQQLYQYLIQYYFGFTAYYFSRPFWWTVDKPIVTALKARDPAFGGATTAYVTASDVNEGFYCDGLFNGGPVTRGYRKQQSVYHHVMVLEGDDNSASWRFIQFEETNKNMVLFNSNLPTQVMPPN